MKLIGYESYTSWIVAIGCAVLHCTSTTPYRIAGLIYVALVDYYETDRETASIPILTFIIVRCLGGPFCGALGEKFSAEKIAVCGSIIAAVGFGGCFFARNIVGVIICLGILFGIGMMACNTLLPTIVTKYFNKNANTANGIAQAGSCLGAILMPPIAIYLLDEYGLPGTFLIISALMLHALPLSLLIQRSGVVQDKIVEATQRSKKLAREEKLSANNQNSSAVLDCSTTSEKISMNNQTFLHDTKVVQKMYLTSSKLFQDPKDTFASEQLSINNPTDSEDTCVSNPASKNYPKTRTDSEDTTVQEKLLINNQKSPTDLEDTCIAEQISVVNQNYSPDLQDTWIPEETSIVNHNYSPSLEDTCIPEEISIVNQNYSPDLEDASIPEKISTINQKNPPDLKNTCIPEEISKANQNYFPDLESTSMPEHVSVINQNYPPESTSKMSETSNIFDLDNEMDDSLLETAMSASRNTSIIPNKTENSDAPEHLAINPDNNLPLSRVNCQINNNIGKSPIADKLSQSTKSLKLCETILKPQDCAIDTVTDISKTNLLSDSIKSDLVDNSKLCDIKNKQLSIPCTIAPIQNSPQASPIENESLNLKSQKKNKFHFLKVFVSIPFLIIMLTTGLHNFVSVLVWTTMIDYSRDKGISRQNEVYFLMMHPFCDIIGRVCFGWVTDLKYLTVTRYSMTCFGIMGLTCLCVLFSAEFWMMILGSCVFAMSCGAMAAVFPGMIFSCLSKELQSMAIASRYALSGPFIFTSAPLIGFFREKNGSYDGIYFLLIAICIICIAIMPLIDKFSTRTRKATT